MATSKWVLDKVQDLDKAAKPLKCPYCGSESVLRHLNEQYNIGKHNTYCQHCGNFFNVSE